MPEIMPERMSASKLSILSGARRGIYHPAARHFTLMLTTPFGFLLIIIKEILSEVNKKIYVFPFNTKNNP